MLVIEPLFMYNDAGLIVNFVLPIEYFELEPEDQRLLLKEIYDHIELQNKLQ